MKSDEQLMELYMAGDAKAFEELYLRHKGKVYGYIRGKCGGSADDVFQNAFARLHRKKHLYRSEYPFLPWFFALVGNVVTDHFRAEGLKRRSATELERDGKEKQKEHILDGGMPENTKLENQETLTALDLDAENFNLLYKKFVEGKGYKELEEEFASGSQALRKRVSRILRKLRHSK